MNNLLTEMAQATALREGPEGVALVLRTIYQAENITLRDLSHHVRLPIPVLAAIRRELERAGIIDRQAGLTLTQQGQDFVEHTLLVQTRHDATCPTCRGQRIILGEEFTPLVQRLEHYSRQLPRVDVTLDQTPCTSETSLRRALYMYQAGALEGKNVIFVGDDDTVCVAVALLGKALGRSHLCQKLTVVETDTRFITYIQDIAQAEEVEIECIEHDLRNPLPEQLHGCYDTFETDPPYTYDGFNLFVSRAVSSLKTGLGQQGFISYGARDPDAFLAVLRSMVRMGLVVQEIIPTFNRYRGASLLGGISQLLHIVTSQQTVLTNAAPWHERRLYTGQSAPTSRVYHCIQCDTACSVGQGQAHQTIETLKTAGCPRCGHKRFRYHRRNATPET